jgi:hypothetical protein
MQMRFFSKIGSSPGLLVGLFVVVLLFLEVFLFNAQAFTFFGSAAPVRTFTAGEFVLQGFSAAQDPALLTAEGQNEHSVKITGFHSDVLTIWLAVDSQPVPVVKVGVQATDAASSVLSGVVSNHALVSGIARSQSMRLHLDGASDQLKINFDLASGQSLRLTSVTLNQPIPFVFSLPRFILLLLGSILALFCRRSAICREPRLASDPLQHYLLLLQTFSLVLVGMLFACAAAGSAMTNFKASGGDIYSRDLVDALCRGQLSLTFDPPAALVALDNPYDPYARAAAGVNALWDAAYFNGNYYVYFGIVPALLLFVPFHLLTSLYLPSVWGVILFGAIGMILLLRLLDRLLCHFFPDLPFRFHLLAALALAGISNLWWCLARPKFYEVVIVAGFCLGVAGLDLLFQCWQDWQKGRHRLELLSAGSLCLALAVGARPNLLLLAGLALPLYLGLLLGRKPCRRERLKSALAIFLPWLLVAAALMTYNFLRFGSISEFGSSYQLTVTDMHSRGMFGPARILPGIWYYLFNFPLVNTEFPFIHFQAARAFQFSGYFYTDARVAGLLVTLPVFWIFAAWPWLRPGLRQIDRRLSRLVLMLVITALVLVAVDSMAAGSVGRYLTDMAWLFGLAAILLAAVWVSQSSRPPAALSAFSVLAVLSLIASLLLALQGEDNLLRVNNPTFYYQLERLFAFWLP